MVVVLREFQGKGFMHRVLEQPFAEAEKKNILCVLDTDTSLKVKKYIRCGMELAGEMKRKNAGGDRFFRSKEKEVHGADIAGERKVSRPTVSVALKALEEEGYIFVDETHEVHLTERGSRIAVETYERHNTFWQLLMGLGVDEKTAAKDACQMEHAVSRESYEALKNLAAEKNGGN